MPNEVQVFEVKGDAWGAQMLPGRQLKLFFLQGEGDAKKQLVVVLEPGERIELAMKLLGLDHEMQAKVYLTRCRESRPKPDTATKPSKKNARKPRG